MIIEAEARGEAAGMMVAVFVLMLVGVILPRCCAASSPTCCAGGRPRAPPRL